MTEALLRALGLRTLYCSTWWAWVAQVNDGRRALMWPCVCCGNRRFIHVLQTISEENLLMSLPCLAAECTERKAMRRFQLLVANGGSSPVQSCGLQRGWLCWEVWTGPPCDASKHASMSTTHPAAASMAASVDVYLPRNTERNRSVTPGFAAITHVGGGHLPLADLKRLCQMSAAQLLPAWDTHLSFQDAATPDLREVLGCATNGYKHRGLIERI